MKKKRPPNKYDLIMFLLIAVGMLFFMDATLKLILGGVIMLMVGLILLTIAGIYYSVLEGKRNSFASVHFPGLIAGKKQLSNILEKAKSELETLNRVLLTMRRAPEQDPAHFAYEQLIKEIEKTTLPKLDERVKVFYDARKRKFNRYSTKFVYSNLWIKIHEALAGIL
ncbi:MAG: hypothetical protein GX221_09065 [Candidatus Riflebacteria bacterium]|nr:hypothetical protein [Candidatus Riflebacteria bacterium]